MCRFINTIKRQTLSDCIQKAKSVDIYKKLTSHTKAQIEWKRIDRIKMKDKKKYIYI